MHLTPDIRTVYHLKWNIIQKPINSWCSSSAVCSRANEQGSSNTEQTAFLAQQKVKVSHTVEHSKKSCKYGQEPLVLLLLQHTPPISFLYFLWSFQSQILRSSPCRCHSTHQDYKKKKPKLKKKSKQFVGITLLNSYGINYCLCLSETLQKHIKTNILSKYPCRCYVNQLNIVWHVRPKNY